MSSLTHLEKITAVYFYTFFNPISVFFPLKLFLLAALPFCSLLLRLIHCIDFNKPAFKAWVCAVLPSVTTICKLL